MKAIVVLAPGFEEIEAIHAIDILRRARVEVETVSLSENTVVLGSHGVPVVADKTLGESGDVCDAIVLPGGLRGVENMLQSDELIKKVQLYAKNGKYCAAVCAAPLVLKEAGVLSGHRFTCHPVVRDRMGEEVVEAPAVWDGKMVTGRSAGCAQAWALLLVEVLLGGVPESVASGLRCPEDGETVIRV